MRKNKIIVIGVCIITLFIIFSSGCYEKGENNKEKENTGTIEIGNVYHTPNNPTATDNVTSFALIFISKTS